MVCAAKKSGTIVYDPQPIDLEDVELTENMIELREAIAENAHDVWAAARINEGWTVGLVRDDDKKQHPDLIPYADLPDSEKQYDRDMAMNTIKLVRKLGYDFVKHSNKELQRLLINKLRAQEEIYHCKKCGASVFKWQLYCDQCGNKLENNDFCN
ncbi:MAG: hypothetical protein F8N35_06545 [Paludibacter sp.]|nr:hypothetical protein [Paludibacter sp.]